MTVGQSAVICGVSLVAALCNPTRQGKRSSTGYLPESTESTGLSVNAIDVYIVMDRLGARCRVCERWSDGWRVTPCVPCSLRQDRRRSNWVVENWLGPGSPTGVFAVLSSVLGDGERGCSVMVSGAVPGKCVCELCPRGSVSMWGSILRPACMPAPRSKLFLAWKEVSFQRFRSALCSDSLEVGAVEMLDVFSREV